MILAETARVPSLPFFYYMLSLRDLASLVYAYIHNRIHARQKARMDSIMLLNQQFPTC